MKKIIKITLAILTILAFLFIIFFILLKFFSRDIPPIDDSDLQIKKIEISSEENAYYDLIRISDIISYESAERELISDYIEGEKWDDEFVEKILSENDDALDYFYEAVQKPRYQDPNFAGIDEITTNGYSISLRDGLDIARLVSLKAIYLARQGRSQEALEEVIELIELGQKIQDSQSPLVYYLVASSIKQQGLETMQKIIPILELDVNELVQYTRILEKFIGKKDGIESTFRVEYKIGSEEIDLVASGRIYQEEDFDYSWFHKRFIDFYFQPNKTKLLLANFLRSEIEKLETPCGLLEGLDVTKLPTYGLSTKDMILTENLLGKEAHDIYVISFSGIQDERCRDDLLVSITQILIALRAYHIETGGYPNSLEELVPKYITEIPKDPFSGGDIKYSASEKIIYSLGKDLIDSGGSEEYWRIAEDPTFRIDF